MKRLKGKKKVLERMGFSHAESETYATLIDAGQASMSDIVRKTGLHRPEAYKAVASLIDAGLAKVMPKGKQKVYVPESPKKLEEIFEEMEDDFNAEIHALHERYSMRDKKPTVTFSEGLAAVRAVFMDVVQTLKKDDVYYRYSSALTLSKGKYLPKNYRRVRDAKGLERLVITDDKSLSVTSKKLGKSVRSVPKDSDLFDLEITQVIYGSKVALIDYGTKSVIVVDNDKIAEFQKKIFRLLHGRL
ncbi:MAG TPA: helix-turn-helix domain-containing protein [Candidatus Paceibacterota bacterium]